MDENRNLLPLGCSWNADHTGNEYGYTWDSYVGLPGLWTACRHSYDAAKKFRNWSCTKCSFCSQQLVCRRVFAPQDSGIFQAIDTISDICCITSGSWESLIRPWKPIFFRTKDARDRKRIKKPLNIGIKFDPAWNEELDKVTEEVMEGVTDRVFLRQFSPRLVFVIRLLFQLAPDGYYNDFKLMLIDDVSTYQSYGVERHGGCRVFDGDQEYVELNPMLSGGTHVPGRNSPMDQFIDDLSYLYMGIWQRISKTSRWMHLFESRFFVALLRRENLIPGEPGD
ncbi:uncharacterized protein FIESC28_00812 [Fusarium coffeatum]|uniref:Uncharacterized protein n=1 Tax=Fusarium coffeatum TaxID=231269 RepID=A0A366SAP9_9HYPO|nr:uncharacterized protein FIESC28_00812 [Fusarium coffeatum]RBR26407.1 hypothetical protein FIESC28_00812 [Fusarium coffeatum]